MSFLTVPFTRLKNTSDADDTNNYETTEMTHIVNLDSFMTLMDGRTILDNHSDDENDDNSSLSTDNSEIMNPNDQSVPNEHGVKYNYNEDEDDFNAHDRDEAEISLVRNDLENGTRSIKKVQLYLYLRYLL